MGLDMYLYATRYLWDWPEDSKDKDISSKVRELVNIPETFSVKEIKIEAGYWRKSNQIHRYFVNAVQDGKDDCGYYHVGRQDLKDLRDICSKVLENRELAATELPTTAGFFFGSKDYDEWYYNDLEETIKILDKALSLPKEWDFEYHSSW